MRLSRAVDYMVRCVLFLAEQEAKAVVGRHEIVAAMGIPDSFFRKIVQQLSKAGIVRTTRGPHGGYTLVIPADKLTLLRVVEVGAGEIMINDCVMEPDLCARSKRCVVHPVWQDLRHAIRTKLNAVTFAELAEHAKKQSEAGLSKP